MGFSQAQWDNRHWIAGVHFLFIVGYALVLVLGIFICNSFHLAPKELKQIVEDYWCILFLPLLLLAVTSWMISRSIPDELTRATRVVDLSRKDLQDRLEALSIAAGLRSPDLYLVDHEAFNALYWEKENDRRLYITRGAVERLSLEEIDCLMAHQLGRLSNGDFRIYPLMSFFITAGLQLTGTAFAAACCIGLKILPLIFVDYFIGLGVYSIIISLGLLWLVFRWYGRNFGLNREFSADLFAIRMTKNASALVCAINNAKDHYYFPIVTEELRAMLFVNPDPGITVPWYADPDERIVHLREALGAGAFEVG